MSGHGGRLTELVMQVEILGLDQRVGNGLLGQVTPLEMWETANTRASSLAPSNST